MDLLERYLESKSESSRRHYRRSFELLEEFMNKSGETFSLKDLLFREREDVSKLPEEQKWPTIRLLNSFIGYLINEKELAPKTVNRILAGITGFFSDNHLSIKGKYLNLPRDKPLKNNKKIIIRKEQVRLMVDSCRSNRDKALVLSIWQSGLGIGDILPLNISDVLDREPNTGSLEDAPLLLSISRKKTGVDFHTCFGRSACVALKRYLDERERVFGTLVYDDPLFIQQRKNNGLYSRMTGVSVDLVFMRIARRSSVVSKERLEKADVNPARPHSLRKGFAGALREVECDTHIIEYMMGHSDPYGNAYIDDDGLKIREIYKKYCDVLEIDNPPIMGEQEFGKKIEELESTIKMLKSQQESMQEKAKIQAARAGGTESVVVGHFYYLLKTSDNPEHNKVAANIEKNLGDRPLSEARYDDLKGTGIKRLKKIELID